MLKVVQYSAEEQILKEAESLIITTKKIHFEAQNEI